jgi:hypothetical protein
MLAPSDVDLKSDMQLDLGLRTVVHRTRFRRAPDA